MNLQDSKTSYVRKRLVIEALGEYASGREEEIGLIVLSSAAIQELQTEEGRRQLRRWWKQTYRTRKWISRFETNRNTGVNYSPKLWFKADRKVTSLLAGLESALIDMAVEREANKSKS